MRIIFATHNQGKVREMQNILSGLDVEIVSAEEAGIFEDVEEDGKTFEENALKKARFIMEKTGEWAVADDSGLCIAALDGAPGIFSSRWAGESSSGDELVNFTLEKMKNIPAENRSAYFESAIALVSPEGKHWTFAGTVDGKIVAISKGEAHPKLPYDVIFVPEGYEKTFAEMSQEEKNKISHRGLAFLKLKEFIESSDEFKK
ncbi:MAG TPA: RdgB/HAM1 family non-canonical purine NTP pyrophosphatase [Candidatus Moranbacteria bacterium]|nr:RdgB/HAM1 family non-canonical purine NTP pyrophosphatase [Candidatus Moranbacteria bacterium]HRY27703.1 RdgB/HAM1 family non-canonical purine NTP pyrophosphatase [Candidatus Moranbacteria bacterium]HSA07974.1 RdgB/HAM1 family non-canonical purine NTP pyrophosphatase [Candidatus Moranbacteria bacterium]